MYDLMSSKESGQDDSEDKNECIVVKSLSWRSPLVDKFLESLDEKVTKDKSSLSLRQMKRRVIAATSSERAKRPTVKRGFPEFRMRFFVFEKDFIAIIMYSKLRFGYASV